ncbi:phosphotransferase family protein [Cohnella endophytica]|nr:aminoglycoside phosphotransferase family protein [Cohnella endophytica]
MNSSYEFIASGRTADILSYADNQVLKLFRNDIPEHLIKEEFLIGQEVFHQGIPCPEPIGMMEYNQRRGIIYQRVAGVTMLRTMLNNQWTLEEEARKMARLHADIHMKTVRNLPKQKEKLKGQIENAPLLTQEEKKRALLQLDGLREGASLCHGDFHPDNIMIGVEKDWVIDWITGMQGNPAGDVARTILMLKWGSLPDETPPEIVNMILDLRNLLLETYIEEYIRISDITREEIDQWLIPVAAARICEWLPDDEKHALVDLIRS